MLDGAGIVREVEAAGARHLAPGAGPESELGLAIEEGASADSEWKDSSAGGWIVGNNVNLEEAAAGDEVGGELVVEHGVEESWWVVVDISTVEGAGRAVELGVALQDLAATVGVAGIFTII